ncbi:MAG: hypothetical protein MZW92_77605 [Comamonadaceae bacterium]|nr:hypothetical protein [Comamonadaceae bacterium]
MLEFEVEIDGIDVNGVDMIAWNAAGRIASLQGDDPAAEGDQPDPPEDGGDAAGKVIAAPCAPAGCTAVRRLAPWPAEFVAPPACARHWPGTLRSFPPVESCRCNRCAPCSSSRCCVWRWPYPRWRPAILARPSCWPRSPGPWRRWRSSTASGAGRPRSRCPTARPLQITQSRARRLHAGRHAQGDRGPRLPARRLGRLQRVRGDLVLAAGGPVRRSARTRRATRATFRWRCGRTASPGPRRPAPAPRSATPPRSRTACGPRSASAWSKASRR